MCLVSFHTRQAGRADAWGGPGARAEEERYSVAIHTATTFTRATFTRAAVYLGGSGAPKASVTEVEAARCAEEYGGLHSCVGVGWGGGHALNLSTHRHKEEGKKVAHLRQVGRVGGGLESGCGLSLSTRP
eukprot:Tamp_21348.p2 GENE.Tamp_21348~~Tamp_21348.p2  ORF type:complete len:130 (-),score=5.51 Tamp_21348:316-705(-)